MMELDGTKTHKIKNTQDIQERVIDKHLNFKLTEDDFAQKGKDAGKVAGDLNKLNSEFDTVKKDWKSKIETKEGELGTILSIIRAGNEDRLVKCVEQLDFEAHMVNYIFNGDIMHSRPMEMHERQMELVTKITSKKDRAQQELKPVADDVKQVIKEETSKKTKQDASRGNH